MKDYENKHFLLQSGLSLSVCAGEFYYGSERDEFWCLVISHISWIQLYILRTSESAPCSRRQISLHLSLAPHLPWFLSLSFSWGNSSLGFHWLRGRWHPSHGIFVLRANPEQLSETPLALFTSLWIRNHKTLDCVRLDCLKIERNAQTCFTEPVSVKTSNLSQSL